MKISNKISLFIFFLLIVLAANTWIGLAQLSKIGRELKKVVEEDILLTESITSITQYQLEKAILFERVMRIAEELGFENITPGRRQYLLNYAELTKDGFHDLAKSIQQSLQQSQTIIKDSLQREVAIPEKDFKNIRDLLLKIEQAQSRYGLLVEDILALIRAGDYQLSIEDIENVEREESKLSRETRVLLKKVQRFTRESLQKAEQTEKFAQKVLRFSFGGSLIVSFLITFLIIRSMIFPLKALSQAAQQVGEGDFNVSLDATSRNEIGEVSSAFNAMAKKLDEATTELEKRGQMLAENLEITDNQKKDLEKLNLELDTFVRTISHDIRAPLTGMSGYSAFLEKNYADQLDRKGQDCVAGIQKSVHRMNSLIEDLLALTRISRMKNPYEEIRTQDLLESTLKSLEDKIQSSRAQIKIEEGLPTVIGDRIKLGSVFFNLIDNAIKFSSSNEQKHPQIQIGYKDQKEFHEFFVKDNGIGIAPEHHLEIFGIFKRMHEAGQYEGTGAGLSIVKGIIDGFDGQIHVESQIGQGACFYFTIPKELA